MVVGPNIEDLEPKPKIRLLGKKAEHDMKLFSRVKRSLIHIFNWDADVFQNVSKKVHQDAPVKKRSREGDMTAMEKLLRVPKDDSVGRGSAKLKLLDSVYNFLTPIGKRNILGLYLLRLGDVFSRKEYRTFGNAVKLIVREIYPVSNKTVEGGKIRKIHEIWKSLVGDKLDFLKAKLEMVFPKVLGRALRTSPVASEAPLLTEALLFQEVLRILDSSDRKIVRATLDATLKEEERLLSQKKRKREEKEKLKLKKQKEGLQDLIDASSKRSDLKRTRKQKDYGDFVIHDKHLLEMLEETMEAEEDRDEDQSIDLEDEDHRPQDCHIVEDCSEALAPLPAGEFPLPLSSSSRTDLEISLAKSMERQSVDQICGPNREVRKKSDSDVSLISGLTDISVPYNINTSQLSMGSVCRKLLDDLDASDDDVIVEKSISVLPVPSQAVVRQPSGTGLRVAPQLQHPSSPSSTNSDLIVIEEIPPKVPAQICSQPVFIPESPIKCAIPDPSTPPQPPLSFSQLPLNSPLLPSPDLSIPILPSPSSTLLTLPLVGESVTIASGPVTAIASPPSMSYRDLALIDGIHDSLLEDVSVPQHTFIDPIECFSPLPSIGSPISFGGRAIVGDTGHLMLGAVLGTSFCLLLGTNFHTRL